ncbi:unnamed protein product [Prunus armeniaca]|uniref:Uncharacterized protein n=1 Tax=Prunus armeniaca TaxID=36596 RepID=A0A6J5TU72_PRUAR|nr:unnamed protein product [Prunus armeniaca]
MRFGSMTQDQKFLGSLLDTLEKRTPLQGMKFMGCVLAVQCGHSRAWNSWVVYRLYNVDIPGAQLVQEFYGETLLYGP